MVLGRKTYEGLAAVWPQLADVSGAGELTHALTSLGLVGGSRRHRGARRCAAMRS
jgi:hypothetical protein